MPRVALVVADKDRRRFEQLTVGGFSEVRLAVVHRWRPRAWTQTRYGWGRHPVAPADVAVFDHYDGVVYVLVSRSWTTTSQLGPNWAAPGRVQALVKLNLCGGHGYLLKISLGSLCHKPHLFANNESVAALCDRSAAKKYRLRQQTIR